MNYVEITSGIIALLVTATVFGLIITRSKQPRKTGIRYPMGSDQHAQIDCRVTTCRFHKNGMCTNVAPAVTLNPNKTFVCWSNTSDE